MKKTYQKPEVRVIEFSLMEAIAATSCAAPIYNHARDENCALLPPFDSMGITFGDTESCDVPVDGYCYFTSANVVFAS